MAVPNNPNTLLVPDGWPKSFFHDKWTPFVSGCIGFLFGGASNFSKGKPYWSGIQKHFIWAAGATALGVLIENKRQDMLAERDATLRHYIELHPEDFPVPERVYVKDLFKPWHPCR